MTGHTRIVAIAAILLFCITVTPTGAQQGITDSTLYTLKTAHHEEYRGYVLRRGSDTLHFRTRGGTQIILPASQVFSLSPVETKDDGAAGTGAQYARETGSGSGTEDAREMTADPGKIAPSGVLGGPATSLFVSPTAYSMQPGEVRLGLYELVFASASAGIAGVADVSAGTILLPGNGFRPYFAGLKIAPLQGEAGALAAGVVYTGDGSADRFMYYGVGTLAIGDGWLSAGYSAGDQFGGSLATIGLDYPVSSVARLMSEVWFPTDDAGVLFCIGARFELDIVHVDVGFYLPLTGQQGDYLTYLPWLGGTFLL